MNYREFSLRGYKHAIAIKHPIDLVYIQVYKTVCNKGSILYSITAVDYEFYRDPTTKNVNDVRNHEILLPSKIFTQK